MHRCTFVSADSDLMLLGFHMDHCNTDSILFTIVYISNIKKILAYKEAPFCVSLPEAEGGGTVQLTTSTENVV